MASLKRCSTALAVLAGLSSFGLSQETKPVAVDEAIPPAVSQVRIVRLSQVLGEVKMDRGLNDGFEATFANTPVVQGTKLATQRGLAEVEFEDNGSLRLGPATEVEFTQLGRTASGQTIDRVRLIKGTLYVSLTKDKQNDFEVAVGSRTVSIPAASHLRLDVYPAGSELVVFKGKVQVADGTSTLTVGTDKALKFGGPDDAAPVLVRDDVPGLYDEWDRNSVEYHNARIASAYAGTPYAYGSRDLSQYGSFVDAGCGSMWQPYFTSAGWNPFGAGVWTYYPGSGYSWVSPYPWGWTPFHYGSWIDCGAGGYGWVPGGSWAGLKNPVLFRRIPGPKPPHPGESKPVSLVVVGKDELRVSHMNAEHKFQFAKDSAGLGVPRDLSVKLGKVSNQVAQHGSAERSMPNLTPITAHTIAAFSAAAQPGGAVHGVSAGGLASRPVASIARASGGAGGSGSISSYSPASGSAGRTSVTASAPAAAPVSSGGAMGGAMGGSMGGSAAGSHH